MHTPGFSFRSPLSAAPETQPMRHDIAPRTFLTIAATLAAALAVSADATASPSSSSARTTTNAEPLADLRILLSSDDSTQAVKSSNSDGLGLYELRRAMCRADADVVVGAPWQMRPHRPRVEGHGTCPGDRMTFRLSSYV